MGQHEILREFYFLYEQNPDEVLTTKQVAQRLGESYISANRQIKMLWFHGYLCLRHLEKRGKAFEEIPLFGKTAYRLNPGVINRCRIMFAKENIRKISELEQNSKKIIKRNPQEPPKK